MSVPAVTTERFSDRQLNRWAERVSDAVTHVSRVPLLDGALVENTTVGVTETPINHKLGRKPRGAIIVLQDADARIWHSSERDSLRLYLTASAAVTVSLWVF